VKHTRLLLPLLSACGGDTAIVDVPNEAPEVAITTPPSGTAYDEGDIITFSAMVDDDRDPSQELYLLWASDIDGVMEEGNLADNDGVVTWVTANITPGNHIITLTAVDSEAGEASDYLELVVHDVPDAPEVAILHPVPGEYGTEGEAFEFSAFVSDLQDEPEDLVVYINTDNEADSEDFCEMFPDASGLAACEYELSVGEHLLSFEVLDLDGLTGTETVYYEVIAASTVDDDGDGWSEAQGDCDDEDPSVHPTAEEFYNDVDDDCDGTVDEGTVGFDDDEDGWTELDGDCDDDDADTYPDAEELCDGTDNDCDEELDEDTVCYDDDGDCYCEGGSCDGSIFDGCTTLDTGDCDDADPSAYPDAPEVADAVDNDCDGSVDEGTTAYDDDGDCYCESGTCQGSVDATCGSLVEGDCDDGDDDISPAASEECDSIDNDCDGDTDEDDATDASTWYFDADFDDYGDPSTSATACTQPGGYVADNTDCDDADSAVNPAASELCNGYDDDCDGTTDEPDADDVSDWYEDADSDGYGWAYVIMTQCAQPSGYVADGSDCDDSDPSTNPGATEYCDGHDDDCDGSTDEADAADVSTFYADDDGDGYGDASTSSTQCYAPSGYVTDATDCDDLDAAAYPGATEYCDGDDDDCDGTVDEADAVDASTWYRDADGDGYGSSSTTSVQCSQPSGYVSDSSDCDDSDASLNPTTTWYLDGDGDGYGSASTTLTQCSQPAGYISDSSDCNDSVSTAYPGATEYCNGYDDDCDGTSDESSSADASTWYLDADSDGYGTSSSSTVACYQPTGYVSNTSDCYDGNASANPGSTSYYASNRGDGSYDYDCDGSESRYYTTSYACSYDWSGFSCDSYTNGWTGSTPGCGSSSTYATGCSASWWSCSYSSTSTYSQYCR